MQPLPISRARSCLTVQCPISEKRNSVSHAVREHGCSEMRVLRSIVITGMLLAILWQGIVPCECDNCVPSFCEHAHSAHSASESDSCECCHSHRHEHVSENADSGDRAPATPCRRQLELSPASVSATQRDAASMARMTPVFTRVFIGIACDSDCHDALSVCERSVSSPTIERRMRLQV